MKTFKENKHVFAIILISLLIVILLVTCFVLGYRNLKSSVKEDNNNSLYGVILETGTNYFKVKDENNSDIYYLNYDKGDLNPGEIVLIKYKNDINNYDEVVVIASKNDDIPLTTPVVTTTTTTTTTKVKTASAKPTTTKVNNKDEDIVALIESDYLTIDGSSDSKLTDTLKQKFITCVDFIFYGTEINGRTFESLTSAAKAKVVYYALLMDNKLDNKWPGYKENISGKYQDTKAMLVAKYLDITSNVCNSSENNSHLCTNLTNDFGLLKDSVGFTWDIIKGAFKYAYDKGSNALINWYKVFSGK